MQGKSDLVTTAHLKETGPGHVYLDRTIRNSELSKVLKPEKKESAFFFHLIEGLSRPHSSELPIYSSEDSSDFLFDGY